MQRAYGSPRQPSTLPGLRNCVLVIISLAGLDPDRSFALFAVDTFNDGRLINSSILLLP